MRKYFFLLLTLFVGFSAQAERFVEGVHYKTFANSATSTPQLAEYFSFYCPHCYRFEGAIEILKAGLPPEAKFVKNHVDNTYFASKEIQYSLSMAVSLVEKMKLDPKLISDLFEKIHQQKQKITELDQIREIFVARGVDGKVFDQAMKSLSIKAQANRMRKNWLSVPDEIRKIGVPSLVVNGKYWLNSKELKGVQDYQDLIAFLLNKR